MNSINELLVVLAKQKDNLENFFSAAKLKQQSLVENNHEMFDEALKSEEKYLAALNQAEKERENILIRLFERNLTPVEKKLETLKNLLKDKITEEEWEKLSQLQIGIKDIAKRITLINSQNLFLIKTAREFLITTVNTLIKDRRKVIIDRKV